MPFDEKKFTEEIKLDVRAQKFFSKFKATNKEIERFLHQYSIYKKELSEYGIQLIKNSKSWKNEGEKIAWRAYELICKRKVFITQCLWRAEKLQISEVETTFDFWKWGQNALVCPFITPANTEEIELMKRFLSREKFSPFDLEGNDNCQAYDSYITGEEGDDFDPYPKWYSYCDKNLAEVNWRELPDIKGEKERHYLDIYDQYHPTPDSNPDKKADAKKPIYFIEMRELAIQLAIALEDSETAQFIKDWLYVRSEQTGPETNVAIFYLESYHEEKIPVKADQHWANGINRAAHHHQAAKAVQLLPEIHEEYQYQKENELLETKQDYMAGIRSLLKGQILKARKILGEPENFNY